MRELERVSIESRSEWRAWLAAHQAQADSIWLVTWKKGNAGHVPHGEIVDEALCFGWVDSLPRKLDDDRSMHLLSPRRSGGAWSKVNKEHAERLIKAGLMAPSGLAKIEEAKRDGLWTKLDRVETLTLPDDLAQAMSERPAARTFWDAFPRSTKRAILEWIEQAKRPETRAARVSKTVEDAASNRRANQWRQAAG